MVTKIVPIRDAMEVLPPHYRFSNANYFAISRRAAMPSITTMLAAVCAHAHQESRMAPPITVVAVRTIAAPM